MSKKRHKETSATGGKNANKRGLKHEWSADTARQAALKGAEKRRVRMAQEAQQRLINLGFDIKDLNALKLTAADYIFYAGKSSNPLRRLDLRERIKVLHGENPEHQLP